MKMVPYQSQNKAPRNQRTAGITLAKPYRSFLWLVPITKGKPCYTSGKPEHSVKNNSILLLNKKERSPKAVRNQVNKLAYRAANIGSMLVK
jgi:hypothetical protein